MPHLPKNGSVRDVQGGKRFADTIYDQVKEMAITYRFRPGERINEVELAKRLSVSRTPLREALNRLVSEGFLTTLTNRGFYCRPFDVQELANLYEFRAVVECQIVGLVCERATDEQLQALEDQAMRAMMPEQDANIAMVLERDETFHVQLARLTRNEEFVRQVTSLNSKIRFARWVDLKTRQRTRAHVEVVEALRRRDKTAAMKLMHDHITRRYDQVVEIIRTGITEIYMQSSTENHLTLQPSQ